MNNILTILNLIACPILLVGYWFLGWELDTPSRILFGIYIIRSFTESLEQLK